MRLEDLWEERPGGIRKAIFTVGDEGDLSAPMVVKVVFPPNTTVSAHTHESDYAEIVLEGSQVVGRRHYVAGDVRIVRGGTVYGPLAAGPDGATVLIVFRDGRKDVRLPRPGVSFSIGAETIDIAGR